VDRLDRPRDAAAGAPLRPATGETVLDEASTSLAVSTAELSGLAGWLAGQPEQEGLEASFEMTYIEDFGGEGPILVTC
jgi:hypothetical protein